MFIVYNVLELSYILLSHYSQVKLPCCTQLHSGCGGRSGLGGGITPSHVPPHVGVIFLPSTISSAGKKML